MKPLLHILFLLLAFTAGARPHTYDVVIVGGTPAGITAAVAAAPVVKPFRKGVPSGCFTVRSP